MGWVGKSWRNGGNVVIRYVESQDDGPDKTRLITVGLKQESAAVEHHFRHCWSPRPYQRPRSGSSTYPRVCTMSRHIPADTRQLIVALRGRFVILPQGHTSRRNEDDQ